MSATRENTLQGLNGLFNVLQRLEQLHREKLAVIFSQSNKFHAYRRRIRLKKLIKVMLVITAVLLLVNTTLYVILDQRGNPPESNSNPLGALFVLTCLIVLVWCSIQNATAPKVNQRRYQKNLLIAEAIHSSTPDLNSELDQARSEYVSQYAGLVPDDFLSSLEVGALGHIIQQGRATTIAEATGYYAYDAALACTGDPQAYAATEQARSERATTMSFILSGQMLTYDQHTGHLSMEQALNPRSARR